MNIHMQTSSLIIMLMLLYFFVRQRILGLYSEKVFLRTLLISIVCVSLDILSVIAIVYRDALPSPLVYLVCRAYLISLMWEGYAALVYAWASYEKRGRLFLKVFTVLLIVCNLAGALLPIGIVHEGDRLYTEGPAVIATYIYAVLCILFTVAHTLLHRGKLNALRERAIRTWMLVWIAASIIQFFNNELLLVGFACGIGMMILFFELENPEAYKDRTTGLCNGYAFMAYVDQLYQGKKKFGMVQFSFRGIQDQGDTERMKSLRKELTDYLQTMKGVLVFRSENGVYNLVSVKKSIVEVSNLLRAKIEQVRNDTRESALYSPRILMLEDGSIIRNSHELIRLFNFYSINNVTGKNDNMFILNQSHVDSFRERDNTITLIEQALSEDRVEVFYQPIYSMSQNSFTTAEALVRIRDLEGKIIPPGVFISVAEETGLIEKLGRTVFEKVCEFTSREHLWDYGVEYIESNLSVVQCENPDLADNFLEIMKKYGVDPARMNLEITESASLHNHRTMLANMEKLIAAGVRFSLDDFGNGESNLDYIVSMPVSIVKFDRGMTKAYFENDKAKLVMEAAMRMIHQMHLPVVSEGIEDEEQMITIATLGIDYIQGFYFSKPLPQDDYLKFLREKGQKSGE